MVSTRLRVLAIESIGLLTQQQVDSPKVGGDSIESKKTEPVVLSSQDSLKIVDPSPNLGAAAGGGLIGGGSAQMPGSASKKGAKGGASGAADSMKP